jgi:hypothetical protein
MRMQMQMQIRMRSTPNTRRASRQWMMESMRQHLAPLTSIPLAQATQR